MVFGLEVSMWHLTSSTSVPWTFSRWSGRILFPNVPSGHILASRNLSGFRQDLPTVVFGHPLTSKRLFIDLDTSWRCWHRLTYSSPLGPLGYSFNVSHHGAVKTVSTVSTDAHRESNSSEAVVLAPTLVPLMDHPIRLETNPSQSSHRSCLLLRLERLRRSPPAAGWATRCCCARGTITSCTT